MAAQQGHAVDVHRPAPGDGFVAALLLGAPQAAVAQVVGQQQELAAGQALMAEVWQAGGDGDAGAGGELGQKGASQPAYTMKTPPSCSSVSA